MKKILLSIAVLSAGISQAQSFESFQIPNTESYWDGSDYSGHSNGAGLFDTTFVENTLEFTSQYDTTWGATYGYWSQGWAFSNQTSDTDQGYAGLFSSYAGGANTGNNYAIGKNGSEITVENNQEAYVLSIQITNNNYAASSMLNGDSFAKQFGSPNDANGNPDGTNGEDWFLLTIKGWDTQGNVTDSILFYLADYRFSDNSQDYILKNWTSVDLSTLGAVNKVTFSLSSSDVGQYGMNTPGFFAMDDIVLSATSIDEIEQKALTIYPNPAKDKITLNLIENGTVKIFNQQGQLVKTLQNNSNQIDVTISDLPIGMYIVRSESLGGIRQTKFIKY